MIIENFEELANSKKKKDCLEILEAGLQAANPENILYEHITPNQITIGKKTIKIDDYSGVYSVAFGKAGDSMTRALNAIIPVKSGIIVIPKGSKSQIKGKKFQIFNSRHPKPDKTSVKAAKEVMKFIQNRRSNDLVIFLVSGGGSALISMPDGITLDDKIHVTDLLLKSGASIKEFNCVRKHLSKIKGEKLVQEMKCHGIGLIMSDVEGDDISTIASGATHADDTTYSDAINILGKYKLKRKVPIEVLQVLEKGLKEEEGNTQDSKRTRKPKIENYVIASNANCINAMKEKAKEIGYNIDSLQVFGDIKEVVTEILDKIPKEPKSCLIFGGEPTVRVLGKGTGGRNQELVLRLLKNTQKLEKMAFASMGTDGIDGNSVFAGAITENIRVESTVMKEFLKNSDSGRFFQKQKSNIITGFTHTNLMDIGIVLK